MKNVIVFLICWCSAFAASAQVTYPTNGAPDQHKNAFALTNATIQTDPSTVLEDATLVVRNGKVVAVGSNVSPTAQVSKFAMSTHCLSNSLRCRR